MSVTEASRCSCSSTFPKSTNTATRRRRWSKKRSPSQKASFRAMIDSELILPPAVDLHPASLFAPTPKAAQRALEFFTTQINNDHTRKSYLNATRRFAEWCEAHGLHQLDRGQPFP